MRLRAVFGGSLPAIFGVAAKRPSYMPSCKEKLVGYTYLLVRKSLCLHMMDNISKVTHKVYIPQIQCGGYQLLIIRMI